MNGRCIRWSATKAARFRTSSDNTPLDGGAVSVFGAPALTRLIRERAAEAREHRCKQHTDNDPLWPLCIDAGTRTGAYTCGRRSRALRARPKVRRCIVTGLYTRTPALPAACCLWLCTCLRQYLSYLYACTTCQARELLQATSGSAAKLRCHLSSMLFGITGTYLQCA